MTDMTMNNLNLSSFSIKLYIKPFKRNIYSCKKIFFKSSQIILKK